ncbi:hypothetical protein BDC45DRAFT_533777 [Circinella umbellata]|nr:hypothetical protein BDC45DRAFT_533777 [Circinella umbellata]
MLLTMGKNHVEPPKLIVWMFIFRIKAQNNGSNTISNELLIHLIRIEELLAREWTVTPVHEPLQARPVTNSTIINYYSSELTAVHRARDDQVGYKENDSAFEVNVSHFMRDQHWHMMQQLFVERGVDVDVHLCHGVNEVVVEAPQVMKQHAYTALNKTIQILLPKLAVQYLLFVDVILELGLIAMVYGW